MVAVAGERRPSSQLAGTAVRYVGGRRRRRSPVVAAASYRDGVSVDEAECSGEALTLSGGICHQLDAEGFAGGRYRLAVAGATEHRQHGS